MHAMARPRARELTERELDVMRVFWDRGSEPATAAEIRDRLAASGQDLAYTTVATLIRILVEKGFVRQVHDQRPYRFEACRSFEEVSGSLLGDLMERVFGGSREKLLIRLLKAGKLTPREREALRRILEERQS
jgi:BlaI family transcriptional regulator, penicillinase repressor